MTVYIVYGYEFCGGDCSDFRIYDVYSNEELAKQRIDELYKDYTIGDMPCYYRFIYLKQEVKEGI